MSKHSECIYCETCDEYIDVGVAEDKEFTCTNKVYCPITGTLEADEDYKELNFNE